MHRLVVDTNVFVSAILGKSFPHLIVYNLVLADRVELISSTQVLDEYYRVLREPKFDKHRDFRIEASALIDKLKRTSTSINPEIQFDVLHDKDDNKFLDLAHAGDADFLITGNSRHFPFEKFEKTEIISPQKYWNTHWK